MHTLIFAHVVQDVFTNFAIIHESNIECEHACVNIKCDIQGVHMGIPENTTTPQIMSTGTHMCCPGHQDEHTLNPHTVPKIDDVASHVSTVHIPRRMPRHKPHRMPRRMPPWPQEFLAGPVHCHVAEGPDENRLQVALPVENVVDVAPTWPPHGTTSKH
jgi:hypothetical protein